MIQKERTREVEVSGVTRQENFKIKAGAKAFKILSDGLYSDKIAAIVRELSTNAYDAHVAAGKADVPIRVRLPDTFNPIFEVQDYGIGLSEDDIYQVYTTYFESTKTDSNDFTGCLGLGSKTPFSYSDSFTVRSVHDGVARTFSAIIGSAGFPEIIKMSEQEVDEPNGVTIRLDVDQDDIRAFERAAQTQLRFFPTAIDINAEINYFSLDQETELEGDNWKIFKDTHRGYGRDTSNVAIQGVVGYPINANQVMSGCNQDDQKIVDRVLRRIDGKIVFTFPIGKLDIAASREELSYDRETQKNLLEACREIHDVILKRENEKLENAKNLWEAFCIANKNASGVLRRWDLPHHWKGQPIDTYGYQIDIKKLFPKDEPNWSEFIPRRPKSNGGDLRIERKSSGWRAYETNLQPRCVVWFGDDKFSRSRYLTFLKQQDWSIGEGDSRVIYIDLNGLQNNTADDVIKRFKKLHPGVPFFRASNYERQKTGSSGSTPDHIKQNLFVLDETVGYLREPTDYWKMESADSGVLVVIDRFYPIDYTYDGVTHRVNSIADGYAKAYLLQNLVNMIKKMKDQKILPQNFKLHAVKKRAADDLLKTGKWEFLDTHLAKAIVKQGGKDLKILRNWQLVQQMEPVYEQIIERVHDAYRVNPHRQRSTAEENALAFYMLKREWHAKSMHLMQQWDEAFNIVGHTPELKAVQADFDVDKLKKQLEPLEILSLVRHAYSEEDRKMIDKFLQKAL